MPLWTPPGPCFQSRAANTPTNITLGASNTKSVAYAEVFDAALVTFDAYEIHIAISNIGANGDTRNALIDIGIDNADTGSFTTLIGNLLCGQAGSQDAGGPVNYRFPLFIKAGTQIGARGQTNDGTNVGSVLVRMMLMGAPKYPELARPGSYVTTFGADTSTSAGTAFTPGNSLAEGSYADLSGADTTLPYWYWEYGVNCGDSIMQNLAYYIDLGIGDGSNKFNCIENAFIQTDSNESILKAPLAGQMGYYEAPAGVRPYGRGTSSGTTDTTWTMAAYGVGG